MHSKQILASLAVLAFITPSSACDPRSISNDTSGGMPPITYGPDTPADPETIGYFINHFSLNVHNMTASIEFYSSVFGLRHIFTVQASEHLSIGYLGHSQGGRNGTGYQTTEELNRDKNNAAGLIELIHLDVGRHLPPSSEKSNTFGHLGVVVPNVEAAQEWLESIPTVEILKRTGEDTPREGKIAEANGFSPEAWAEIDNDERQVIQAVLDEVNRRFIYVADPDGNIIEIQPQH